MKNRYKRYLKKRQKEQEKMYEMRSKGATLQEIGDVFGVSRQRIQQIFARKK